MFNASLEDFIKVARATNRITFGDVKRLRRIVFPEGLVARDEVEELLELDATIARRDASWTDWLVPAVVDFAVWGERPTGFVEGEQAAWISGLLARHGLATKAARMIAREIEAEAEAVDESLTELAGEAGIGEEDEAGVEDEALEDYDALEEALAVEPAIIAEATRAAA